MIKIGVAKSFGRFLSTTVNSAVIKIRRTIVIFFSFSMKFDQKVWVKIGSEK